MLRRRLGRSGIDISVLGLGGAGMLMNQRAEVSDQVAQEVVQAAVRLGVNYVDTSPAYGDRLSERRVGAAVGDRSDVVVATKTGMTAQGGTFTHDFSAEHTRRSVQLSAKELRREVLDVVQLHELTGEQCGPALAGAVQELERLKEEGRLRLIGVTGSDPVALLEAVRSDRFDTVMVWKIWNLLDERGDEVLDEAAARGMGVLVGAPFASGILATGPTEGAQLHYGTATAEALDRVRALQAQSDEPLAVRALRFCLDDRVTAVVAAVESLRQLEENVTMMESVTAARGLA